MSLEIVSSVGDSVTTFALKGSIIAGEGANRFREVIHQFAASGGKHLILDLADVNHIDSTGIGALISGLLTMLSHDGTLVLCHITERVNELLRETRLNIVLDIR